VHVLFYVDWEQEMRSSISYIHFCRYNIEALVDLWLQGSDLQGRARRCMFEKVMIPKGWYGFLGTSSPRDKRAWPASTKDWLRVSHAYIPNRKIRTWFVYSHKYIHGLWVVPDYHTSTINLQQHDRTWSFITDESDPHFSPSQLLKNSTPLH
jgi:hypothetical protein